MLIQRKEPVKITIAIIDDQSVMKQGLAALLRGADEFVLLAQAHNGRELFSQLKELHHLPEVLLMDLNIPGINGVELTGILHRGYPSVKVVVVTRNEQERFISKLIEAGVSGYLSKNYDKKELFTCIHTLHKTGFYFSAALLKALQQAQQRKSRPKKNARNISIELSNREQEVLYLICKEFTNAQIADKLFISVRNVETHRNSLLAKTGCRNTAGLVIFAVGYGIYELEF